MRLFLLTAVILAATQPLLAQQNKDMKDRHIKSVIVTEKDENKPKNNAKTSSKFDKKGRLIEYIEYDKDNAPDKWEIYTYHKNGLLYKTQKMETNGNLLRYYTYTYDHLENKTQEQCYDAKDNLLWVNNLSYDANGKKTEEVKKEPNGKLKERTVYQYDNKGMILSKEVYDQNNTRTYAKTYEYQY